MKLTVKIVSVLMLGGAISAAVIIVAGYVVMSEAARGRMLERERAIAEKIFAVIDQFLYHQRSSIMNFAASAAYPETNNERARMSADMHRFAALSGVWNDISLLDKDGIRMLSTRTKLIETNAATTAMLREALRKAFSGDITVVDALRATVPGDRALLFFAPVYRDGRIRGVIEARLAERTITEFLDDVPKGVAAYLLDGAGKRIGASGADHGDENYAAHPAVLQLQRDEIVTGMFDGLRDGSEMLAVFMREPGYRDYSGNHWIIAVEAPRAAVWAEFRDSALLFAVLTLAIIGIFACVIAYVFQNHIVAPLAALARGARDMIDGTFSGFDRTFARDETGNLSEAIRSLWEHARRIQRMLVERVREKTMALESRIRKADEQNKMLEETKRAIVNVMDDLRKEESLLQEERDKLSVALRGIGDGVFVIDNFEVVTFFNSAAEGLTGYAAGDVVGRPYQETLKFMREADGATHLKFIDDVFSSEHALRIHPTEPLMLLRKNGTRIAVAASAAPLRNARGDVTGVVVVFRDVSREREIDRAKSEFISLATHQLRTPLTTMRWIPEMLLEGAVGKLSARQRKYIDDMRRSSERLVQLINKLLSVARIESRRIEVIPEEVDARALLLDIQKDFTRETKSRKQRLLLRLPKAVTLRTDPKILGEVIRNLLANAVKYTPNGGRIEVSVISAPRGKVVFHVKDNGIGIPAEQQARIFGKFFRADNAAKTDVAGTGLGLYLVKQFVELLGGAITFESVERKGTVFTVTLPIKGPETENRGV